MAVIVSNVVLFENLQRQCFSLHVVYMFLFKHEVLVKIETPFALLKTITG